MDIERHVDSSLGITWDTIDCAIDNYLDEN